MQGRWDPETLEDALDVLGDVPGWRLPASRWPQVGAILDRLAQAFEAGEDDELRAWLMELELHGPVRANRIGTKEIEGPDRSLLERQNRLVHDLTRAASDEGSPVEAVEGRDKRTAD